MGVPTGAATLEIQLIADVARLQRDMAAMKTAVADATGSATAAFNNTSAASVAAATRMAAGAQAAARAAMGGAAGVATMGNSMRLSSQHAMNLGFQINDVVSGLVMGQNPFRIAAQQGGQFYQIMQQSGMGAKSFAVSLLELVGIVKVVGNAELNAAAAFAASQAASIKAMVDRSASTLAARQTTIALAQAELAAAETAPTGAWWRL
jgi:hypothetical protein